MFCLSVFPCSVLWCSDGSDSGSGSDSDSDSDSDSEKAGKAREEEEEENRAEDQVNKLSHGEGGQHDL